jgi:AcrR family transcriptional regulator
MVIWRRRQVPKQVDHDERRREIVEALFRVAARDGLAAATYRTIAADAEIKPAQVQYYFPTKAALLESALLELGRRIVGRGLQLIEQIGPDPRPEQFIRAAVTGSHPVDDDTRRDLVLFFIFFGAALSDPAVAGSGLITSQRFIGSTFASLIRTAQEQGEVAADLDPEHEARLVLFANTGLIFAALVGIHSLDEATSTMEYLLSRLFRPPTS